MLSQVVHQGNCCASTRGIPAAPKDILMDCCVRAPGQIRHPHFDLRTRRNQEPATPYTWTSLRAQRDITLEVLTPQAHGSVSTRTETCSCEETVANKSAAFSRRKHAWLSLAAGTLGSHSVPMRHAHAASTLGSLSVRKETCSCEKTVATKNCCVLTRQAHLDLTPCAMRHVHATRLLRSHAASTLGSLSRGRHTWISLRANETCSRRKHTWISLGAQRDMFL